MAHVSPYHAPGFFEEALAKGKHRDIVGGRWEETGIIQMEMLEQYGLRPDHRFLDIGAGSLRLGCRLVPYLNSGNYWATDVSGELMRRGYDLELVEKDRLPVAQLIEDANFAFPGVTPDIDIALAFAVFTHLPMNHLRQGLMSVRRSFPRLQQFMFTVFLAPDVETAMGPVRQPDGVVTHPTRTPYHTVAEDVRHFAQAAGFDVEIKDNRLPRGQILCIAKPA